MKYYKRLWENKCYKVFIAMFILALIGILAVYFSFYSSDGDYSYVFLMDHIVLVPHNGGLLLAAAFCFYTGFGFIPSVAREAQDLSEFHVEGDKEWLYISYGKYAWKVGRSRFSPEQFCLWDAKRHFVGISTAYRVYNAICDHEEVRRELYEYASDELLWQMDGKVRLSPEEKKKYIKKFRLNKSHPFRKMFALFLAMGALSSLQMPSEVIDPTPLRLVGGALFGIFLFLMFGAGSIAIFYLSNEDKKEYRYLKNHDIYRVRVYCYDKDCDREGNYIRISDGKGSFFPGYYHVTKQQWENAESIAWYAYYYSGKKGNLSIRVMEGII